MVVRNALESQAKKDDVGPFQVLARDTKAPSRRYLDGALATLVELEVDFNGDASGNGLTFQSGW